MLAKLKIAQKGLLVVAVPLLLELILVVALGWMLAGAQAEVDRQVRAKMVLVHGSNMMRYFLDAVSTAALTGITKDPSMIAASNEALQSFAREFKQVRELVRDQPEQLRLIEQAGHGVVRTVKLIRRLIHSTEGEFSFLNLLSTQAIFKQMQVSIETFGTPSIQLLNMEQDIEGQGPSGESHFRQRIGGLLAAAVALNIVLSLLLGWYFSSQITGRLRALTDNAGRLLKGQTLLPLVGGRDEVAQLDQVFHEMSHQLDEAQQLKRRLVSLLSERLRGPLMSVDTRLGQLVGNKFGELAPTATRKLTVAEADVVRLLSLINDLVQVQNVEPGQLEMHFGSTQLSSVVERSLAAVGAFAGQKKVQLEAASTQASVWADENRLIQVLVNLLSNAIKFSPAKGTVSIAVQDLGDQVEVAVIDQGRGIPANLQQAVFERYKQVELGDALQKGGTGLGLSICRTIIEAHSGTIGVNSEEGKGSTFWFTLPRQATPGTAPPGAES